MAETFVSRARRLIAKATPREWRANPYLGGAYAIDRVAPNGDRLARIAVVDGLVETGANAALIPFAVNSLPALADVVEAAEALSRQLGVVVRSDAFQGVFAIAAAHGARYGGPTFVAERDALDRALAALEVPHA